MKEEDQKILQLYMNDRNNCYNQINSLTNELETLKESLTQINSIQNSLWAEMEEFINKMFTAEMKISEHKELKGEFVNPIVKEAMVVKHYGDFVTDTFNKNIANNIEETQRAIRNKIDETEQNIARLHSNIGLLEHQMDMLRLSAMRDN